MSDREILTLEEVADYLRVSERTVYDWANKGEIPCGKLGTTWRFKRSEVERWVDEKLSGRNSAPGPQSQPIRELLSEDRVVILDTPRKAEALTALVDCIASSPKVKKRDELEAEIFLREELMSTGIGFNVAVPHVRLNSVTDLVVAVGINQQNITDYESLDEAPIRIICMIAARLDQHAQYLKLLGAVSALLKSSELRQSLISAADAKTAYGILTR